MNLNFHIIHFFIRTIVWEREAHFCLKLKNKLRTIHPQQKNKVSNFQLKYSEKTAASAAQFAKCILLNTYLTSWLSTFDYKLRTIEAENP